MATTSRLLLDPPADGAWNMAVDEALLESVAGRGQPTIRFYEWSPPTLSLGYFQPYSARQTHQASLDCPCVRRASGGGAILHDAELTYSLVLPADHHLARSWQSLSLLVHEALAAVLSPLTEGSIKICTAPNSNQPGPFLCFLRHAPGDIIQNGAKIAGSAQRRRSGGLLQHGSILLRQAAAAPELVGWEDLGGHALTARQLAERWLPFLERSLDLRVRQGCLAPAEQQYAARANSKYGCIQWNERR